MPTGGTARFSSPLSVDDFVKKYQYTYYTADALAQVAGDIAAFAKAEGLEAHARSVTVRAEAMGLNTGSGRETAAGKTDSPDPENSLRTRNTSS